MAQQRESIFSSGVGDLTDFAPKPKGMRERRDDPAVSAVAEEAGFQSREPRQVAAPPPPKPQPERLVQVGFRTTEEVRDAIDAVAHRYDWPKRLVLERAVGALQRALADGIDPKSLDHLSNPKP